MVFDAIGNKFDCVKSTDREGSFSQLFRRYDLYQVDQLQSFGALMCSVRWTA